VYGAEVWQIAIREINKILTTEMDVLRRSARKSTTERMKNENIKEIMGDIAVFTHGPQGPGPRAAY